MSKRPSQIAADRIRALRRRHDWTQQQLADRLGELGHQIDRVAIAKLENCQRGLPLDEALLFAFALDVAPINLFLPTEEEEDVQIAPHTIASSAMLREWVVGDRPLAGPDGGQDPRIYLSERPVAEFLEIERVDRGQFKRELAEATDGSDKEPSSPAPRRGGERTTA